VDLSRGGDVYGHHDDHTLDDLCARLHGLVDRLAALRQPALLWALVVLAEEALGERVRWTPFSVGYVLTLAGAVVMLS
jgi:hypothetical protein